MNSQFFTWIPGAKAPGILKLVINYENNHFAHDSGTFSER